MASTLPGEIAQDSKLISDLLGAFDQVFGLHPGFRPVHAKGAICSGTFTASSAAKKLTRAPHVAAESVPVHVRFSNFAGIPNIPDNHIEAASPRGFGIRFYPSGQLGGHVHTDLVAHSTDGFPTRTGEEFLGFIQALAASGPASPKPTPIEQFLGAHPAAMEFAMSPKPFPTSFARESYFAVSAFRLINSDGHARFGRFAFKPAAGNEYLLADAAAEQSPNYLFDELATRLGKKPIEFEIQLQLAEAGDKIDDATVRWPAHREVVSFGTVKLTKLEDSNQPELRKIIFDPRPRIDGLEATADPLFEVRAAIYLMSGRRRRAATPV